MKNELTVKTVLEYCKDSKTIIIDGKRYTNQDDIEEDILSKLVYRSNMSNYDMKVFGFDEKLEGPWIVIETYKDKEIIK